MSSTILERKCNNAECTVADSGICSDGHKPVESCPNFGKDLLSSIRIDSNVNEEQPKVDLTHTDDFSIFYSGELLNSKEVEKFLLQKPVIFISIIGDRDSGKTTFISSLYERFRRGKFAGYLFSGSSTLIGFEKCLHYSRLASRSSKIDTPRTLHSDGLSFFHLSICPQENLEERREILFSDRAGETYRNARNNTDSIADLTEIPRSDRVLLLLDGARIINPEERSDALQSTRQMLWALIDNNALNNSSNVQIVTTKFDLISVHPENTDIVQILDEFKNKLKLDFGHKIKNLAFFDISARDPSKKFELVYGVDNLLLDWISLDSQRQESEAQKVEYSTQFDLLLLKSKLNVSIL
ncbi:TRAFAC clade GTPase domain-containing protein [Leptospira weilii]|uniref:TRAFAC clade GTPase domain-containing protein n=1 Tax=Leptospira weilii TaxID=28184 RepID=UPI0007741AF9|nr:hypothetical protein [Leptospira weilii]